MTGAEKINFAVVCGVPLILDGLAEALYGHAGLIVAAVVTLSAMAGAAWALAVKQ